MSNKIKIIIFIVISLFIGYLSISFHQGSNNHFKTEYIEFYEQPRYSNSTLFQYNFISYIKDTTNRLKYFYKDVLYFYYMPPGICIHIDYKEKTPLEHLWIYSYKE